MKKMIMVFIIILIVLSTTGGYYYFSKAKPHRQFLNNGNSAMAIEEYGKAIILYEEALSYKKDIEVSKKIDMAKILKKSKEIYELASKQMIEKNYLGAIEIFKKVAKQDTKRYSIAQSKVNECEKNYISDNLIDATNNLASGKFDEAFTNLDNIFKLDVDNVDAKKVKDNIATAIQKQKDDILAAQAKALEEARAKELAKAKALAIAAAKAKAKKEASTMLTIDQAKNILITHKTHKNKNISEMVTFYYSPEDNYVNSETYSNYAEIRNNYYIFQIRDYDATWDCNMCVNKKTGEVYVADPSGSFSTLYEYSKHWSTW